MADVTVAPIPEEDMADFIDQMKKDYGPQQEEGEDDEVFAKRVFQEQLDAKVLEEKKNDWTHTHNLAHALWEEQYQKDNPPPEGVVIEPPNTALLAEAKAKL